MDRWAGKGVLSACLDVGEAELNYGSAWPLKSGLNSSSSLTYNQGKLASLSESW